MYRCSTRPHSLGISVFSFGLLTGGVIAQGDAEELMASMIS